MAQCEARGPEVLSVLLDAGEICPLGRCQTWTFGWFISSAANQKTWSLARSGRNAGVPHFEGGFDVFALLGPCSSAPKNRSGTPQRKPARP